MSLLNFVTNEIEKHQKGGFEENILLRPSIRRVAVQKSVFSKLAVHRIRPFMTKNLVGGYFIQSHTKGQHLIKQEELVPLVIVSKGSGCTLYRSF